MNSMNSENKNDNKKENTFVDSKKPIIHRNIKEKNNRKSKQEG